MNFLAHLHLSGDDPGFILGGILGDFARGLLPPGRFPEPVRQGIILHRKIDALTDTHPVWRSSKSLLPQEQRRYAGIIIDVIYDHFLAKHWHLYSRIPFTPWVTSTYKTLDREIAALSALPHGPTDHLEEAAEMIAAMTERDWLHAYLEPEEIPKTLTRISNRSPRLAPMRTSGDAFDSHYADFESHFLTFYPDLMARCGRNIIL